LFKALDESHLMNTNDTNWARDKEEPAASISFDLSIVGARGQTHCLVTWKQYWVRAPGLIS
jgi:hypothetical protein